MSDTEYKATVFIPTWFGEQYLKEVLKMIFRQDVPFAYEVLIYDTSSTDATPQIIESFQKKHANLRYETITKKEFGHGRTRNRAAHDAKGEIVVYLSQDATPSHKRWLYEMVKPFELNDKIVGVMGKQIPRPTSFPLQKHEIRAVFNNLGPDFGTTIFYKDDYMKKRGMYDAVCFYSDVNSAARKDYLIEKFPYKDVQYAEDQLFGRDIIDAGYMKVYAPRGSVTHSNDLKLGEYRHRIFDEIIGLRKVGIPVAPVSRKAVIKMFVKGVIKDWIRTLLDKQYSTKRRLFYLAVNPLYHIEKWRGVRLALAIKLNEDAAHDLHSLEKRREIKHEINK
jgi:rhamnosyltransferase